VLRADLRPREEASLRARRVPLTGGLSG
jgi:hypothetical protein